MGNVDKLASLLARDVVSHADGGGVAAAATRPVQGIRAVTRLYAGMWARCEMDLDIRLAKVNGWPSLIVAAGSSPVSVIQVRTRDAVIDAIFAQVNPDKLRTLRPRRAER